LRMRDVTKDFNAQNKLIMERLDVINEKLDEIFAEKAYP
jgi:hypothetical protein